MRGWRINRGWWLAAALVTVLACADAGQAQTRRGQMYSGYNPYNAGGYGYRTNSYYDTYGYYPNYYGNYNYPYPIGGNGVYYYYPSSYSSNNSPSSVADVPINPNSGAMTDYRVFYPSIATTYPNVPAPGTSAVIHVQVPPDAQVWFHDQKTSQTGSMRRFVTPPLKHDHDSTYDVTAKWMADGKEVSQTRKITVTPGGQSNINFNAPEGS